MLKYIITILSIVAIFLFVSKEVKTVEAIYIPDYEECEDIVTPKSIVTVEDNIREEIRTVFGPNWRLAFAIMMSEGGGNVKATNHNRDSIDRGLFQINSKWHPEVSEACAYDLKCNVKEAYRISDGGTNWQPWYGYTNGHYRKFL